MSPSQAIFRLLNPPTGNIVSPELSSAKLIANMCAVIRSFQGGHCNANFAPSDAKQRGGGSTLGASVAQLCSIHFRCFFLGRLANGLRCQRCHGQGKLKESRALAFWITESRKPWKAKGRELLRLVAVFKYPNGRSTVPGFLIGHGTVLSASQRSSYSKGVNHWNTTRLTAALRAGKLFRMQSRNISAAARLLSTRNLDLVYSEAPCLPGCPRLDLTLRWGPDFILLAR